MANFEDFNKLLPPELALPDMSRHIAEYQRMSTYTPPMPSSPAEYASEFHKRLMKWIADFDATLDETHEVGIRLVNFGQTVVFHFADIGYWNPSLICFYGVTDDGNPVELIQHVNQISVLLMKLPRKDPSAPKRRIGFKNEGE